MLIKRNKAIMVATFLYGLMAFAFLSIGSAFAQGKQEGPEYYRCYLEGIELAARCLDLKVPQDWDNPEGPQINLHMAIVPAKGGFSEPDPFLIFSGGPGQAATDAAGLIRGAFDEINERREIILIDIRGTGSSNPLECKGPLSQLGYVPENVVIKGVNQCLETYTADVRYFTSFDVLKDIEHVRKTLGIEKFNIWGGSFGTRLGLLYMKLYPESIRSVILDGVTPPTATVFVLTPTTAENAWQKLVLACEGDPACRQAFPNLDSRFRELLEKLRLNPVVRTLQNPLTGEMVEGLYNDVWLAQAVFGGLYFPSRAGILPLAIAQAEIGDFKVLNALALDSAVSSTNTIAMGSMLSIFCSEDIPIITPGEAEKAGEGSFQKDFFYRSFQPNCTNWPTRNVTEGYDDPVTSDIPTLILSGELDPVTPPLTANEAAKHLGNVLHLTAANSGHGVSGFGCAPDLMADFVKAASVEGLDGSCLNDPNRPPFVITPLGPRPLSTTAKEN